MNDIQDSDSFGTVSHGPNNEAVEDEWEEDVGFFVEFINEYFQFSGVYDLDDRDTRLYGYILKNRHRKKRNHH